MKKSITSKKTAKGKMYCYVWHETTDTNECKFGEKWVEEGESSHERVQARVRESLAVRKDKFDEGKVVLDHFWDVSDYALMECPERHKMHGKVDDFIRNQIGFRKGKTGEVHTLDAIDMINRVNDLLKKSKQKLPVVGVSQNQHDAAVNVLNAMKSGKRTVVAELCARFGKTIWSGALIRETNSPLTIVASYVLTSFASFKKDLSSFEQFRNLTLVEAGEADWEKLVNDSLKANRQTVVFLSMCAGGRRQDKIDFLFSHKAPRLLIIDEADFGVHKAGQSEPLKNSMQTTDRVVLMTGTNGDKAASIWPVDHYLSVTYPELLIEKNKVSNAKDNSSLKNFEVDPSRHQLYVDVEFYQMNLTSVIENTRKADMTAFEQDGIFLPSWSKFAANPVKAKGFFINMLQAVFEGKGGDDSLNVDFQTGRRAKEGTKVAMMFLPGSTTNANLEEIIPIAEQALKGFDIVAVYGEEMTNATAEKKVRERIEKAMAKKQHVLILSAGMAQRSFSIPQITELYLAYDSGDNGATIQKMSRTLTPDTVGKIGRVISLSFDPNRDDKFDAMILETAKNYKQNHKVKDMKQALRDVLKTVDIFKCQSAGAVKVEIDTYLEEALARNSIDRVIGKVTDVKAIHPAVIAALIQGKIDVYRAAKKEAADKGKTKLTVSKAVAAKSKNLSKSDYAKAREMIVTIAQNINYILDIGKVLAKAKNLEDCFSAIDEQDESYRQYITDQYGLDYEIIRDLILDGTINRDLLELKFS